MLRFFLTLTLLLIIPIISLAQEKTSVTGVLVSNTGSLVINLTSSNIDYDYFELAAPNRLVVDFRDATTNYAISKKEAFYIKDVTQKKLGNSVRVIFEFYNNFKIKDLKLDKLSKEKYRLKFQINVDSDLSKITDVETIDEIIDIVLAENSQTKSQKKAVPKAKILEKSNKKRTIIIDAGHGGKDPGAIGFGKVREKDLTLEFALYLYNFLKKETDYNIVLTRKNDIFLNLSDRNKIARKHNADLFISLHVDAARTTAARGLSVYTLSDKASDIEAAKLAKKENSADVIAGVDLTGYNYDVKSLLIDLSQEQGKAESKSFAKILVNNLKGKILIRKNTLRFAGFAVLKNANMASVLIELGFITNKKDYKMLKSTKYRKSLTRNLKKSIDEYFSQN